MEKWLIKPLGNEQSGGNDWPLGCNRHGALRLQLACEIYLSAAASTCWTCPAPPPTQKCLLCGPAGFPTCTPKVSVTHKHTLFPLIHTCIHTSHKFLGGSTHSQHSYILAQAKTRILPHACILTGTYTLFCLLLLHFVFLLPEKTVLLLL